MPILTSQSTLEWSGCITGLAGALILAMNAHYSELTKRRFNMELDEKSLRMRRMQADGMRALTDAEIAELQQRAAPSMQNNSDAYHQNQGMQNAWVMEEIPLAPEKPRLSLWQRLKQWGAGGDC